MQKKIIFRFYLRFAYFNILVSILQLCNVEEERSQHSGENIQQKSIRQLSTSNLVTAEKNLGYTHKSEIPRTDIEHQGGGSSSSLSSEYNSPRRGSIKSTKVSQNNIQNGHKYKKYPEKARKLPDQLLVPTGLERLAVARQCLNSVTDLSTDELSMTGNASDSHVSAKEFQAIPKNSLSVSREMQNTEAPTSELIDTEKSFAMSEPSNNNSPRKVHDGDVSLASISLGSANLPLPSSASPSTTFTLSGRYSNINVKITIRLVDILILVQ
jgi:hypothetical protein